MMRVAVATAPGDPEVFTIEERPDLIAEPGRVVIEVAVAATTFIDTQLRAGRGPRPLPREAFPVVLGNGVAGTVVDIGEGVDLGWLGARVVSSTGGSGGYATQASAASEELHRIPEQVADEAAVAVLADGRTALSLADAAAVRPGDVVVVCAAAGGVGSLLVQRSLQAGAKVIGLAGSEEKRAFVRSLGAIALDYTSPRWLGELDATEPAIDVVFDGVGGETSGPLVERIAVGGRYLPHGAASGAFGSVDAEELATRQIRTVPLFGLPSDAATLHRYVEEALTEVAAGRLVPAIGARVPLERVGEAHAAMEARSVIGKTLLVVGSER
jgi:NADPH2:quinone reductase